jgi:hypothetical protein
MFDKKPASEEQQTEFNAAIATLMRIDEIKKGMALATVREDYDLKWKFLKAYFFELISVMDSEDDGTQRQKFLDVRQSYNIYRHAKLIGQKYIPSKVVDSIDDWEIELRNIEQRYGMNLPKKADPRYALATRR